MNLSLSLSTGFAFFALALVSATAAPLRVLYFTKSSGYEHSVVKQVNEQPSYSARILAELGALHDFTVTSSKDGSLFSPAYFQQFDLIIFYTCGDLASPDNNGAPGITPAGKQALLDAVAGGKGFMALHSTSFIAPGSPNQEERYHNRGDAADPFVKLLGGEFINHNAQQVARARIVDRSFPGCAGLGATLEFKEEWYSLKEFAPDIHVVLVMDTAGMEGSVYERPPYPLAWVRLHGKGRVWFNALGHREDVWDNPQFRAMVVGGVEWTSGRQSADIQPNLQDVAPAADTLPPFRPDK